VVNNKDKGLNKVAGLVGLGRGPLSLVSQLGSRKFSYCLTSIDENKDLTLSNGDTNSNLPSFYYLSMRKGKRVGTK
jgi:hypothetical protein